MSRFRLLLRRSLPFRCGRLLQNAYAKPVARFLPFMLAAMITACPYPVFDIEGNLPVVLSDDLLDPLQSAVPPLDCTQQGSLDTIQLRLNNAIEDLNGDPLNVFWYVNYDDEQPSLFQAADIDIFDVSCTTPGLVDGTNIIDAVVMDRAPSAFSAAGARKTQPDGFSIRVMWVLEVSL
jgi:hypothetical protein